MEGSVKLLCLLGRANQSRRDEGGADLRYDWGMILTPRFQSCPWRAARSAKILRAVVFLCAAALLGLVGSAWGARAQDEGNDQFWLQERARQRAIHQQQKQMRENFGRLQRQRPMIYQRPTHLIRRAKPVRGFSRAEPPAQPAGAPASSGSPAPIGSATLVPAPSPPKAPGALPKAKSAFTVAVLGDGLARVLGRGLADAYADRADVAIVNMARKDSGLAQDDGFDWIKAARRLVSSPPRPDMAVMLIGSDDRQPIAGSSGLHEPFSAKWRRIYASRVAAIESIFHAKNIPLLWVGAPIMKDASLSDAMLNLNDIYRRSAAKVGASYLDDWDLFADESGRYALYGPDVNGDTAKLRKADGILFTRAGARKLAQVVEAEIKRVMDGMKPQVDPALAGVAPEVAPAEPLSPASLPVPAPRSPGSGNELRALLPAPAAPIRPVIPVKPAAGPVVALTAPVVAPDGQLATLSSAPSGMNRADEALRDGRTVSARSGRADDFAWPPH
ncbi:MAG TPA: hypothetical protein VND97_08930 [Beijerinckiaceae bacterium]|nr:hypothetical protein [Beijerinckiaceae bacterium]